MPRSPRAEPRPVHIRPASARDAAAVRLLIAGLTPLSQHRRFFAGVCPPSVIAYIVAGIGHFIGMLWADWTAGGHVREEVLDEVLAMLARGLTPRGDAFRQGNDPAC